jgi:hypothetical protein
MKEFTTLFLSGAGLTGMATVAATVYNSGKTIQSNEKIQREIILSQERVEMEKIELEKAKLGLSSKYNLDPVTSNQESNEDKITLVDLSNTSKDCVICSPFEIEMPDFHNHTLLQTAGFSFACFAFIGLYAGISLGLNLLIKYYGDQNIQNLPKWSQTLFKFYSQYLVTSTVVLICFIIGSQAISLLFGLYLFFYGV